MQIIGALMILAVFIIIFFMMVDSVGFYNALSILLFSIGLTTILVIGAYLLVGGI